MSELPPPPPGSKITVELKGQTLRVVVPGRWTAACWILLLSSFLFVVMSLVLQHSLHASFPPEPGYEIDYWAGQLFPVWGVLCLIWFFFVTKSRLEWVTLGSDFLETGGSFVPFMPRKMGTSELRRIVLKAVGPGQLMQAPLLFYGFNRRKLLFAEGGRDIALAIQAGDAELVWLQGVLESHLRSLRPPPAGEREKP